MFDDISSPRQLFHIHSTFPIIPIFFTILSDAGNPAVDSDSLSRLQGFPTDDSNHRLSGDSPTYY